MKRFAISSTIAALEDTANAAYPNASSTADAVAQYCNSVTPGGK
jgi:hypothetical protein